MTEPSFLTFEEVLLLHRRLIEQFGGDIGIFNLPGLEAAIAQPAMRAFGELLHRDLIEQAAAYLFHLVANHPFCDGNKRIGMHVALTFLIANGATIHGDDEEWYKLTMAVARGEWKKSELTTRMRALVTLPRS